MNYCQDGLQVYFATETQQYNSSNIYGHYELQTNDVNGRPYFKMGSYGLWWDIKDFKWMIGPDSMKGEPIGSYAYYRKDVFCPDQLSEWNWLLGWNHAGNDLGTTCCKYMHFHSKKSLNSIFNSKINFS